LLRLQQMAVGHAKGNGSNNVTIENGTLTVSEIMM
jgi:hypothetical protein